MNSPVVRAETLKFREEGVRDVISRVLLPWLNSFRFFLGQAALFEKENGVAFKYDPHSKRSENVMDRWILARCQSLIKLVREEMEGERGPLFNMCIRLTLRAAYRLYTIIGRLLGLIDEITNWYIRFNRKRLKGENGKEDTTAALNTLFETLFTLTRTMVCVYILITLTCANIPIVIIYTLHDRERIPRSSAFHSFHIRPRKGHPFYPLPPLP